MSSTRTIRTRNDRIRPITYREPAAFTETEYSTTQSEEEVVNAEQPFNFDDDYPDAPWATNNHDEVHVGSQINARHLPTVRHFIRERPVA